MELAKNITIDRKRGVITIDGKDFGFYVADEEFDVTVDDVVSVVRLPLLTESVTIVPAD